MRTVDTFVFVLTAAGLLCTSIALEYSPGQNEVLEGVSHLLFSPASSVNFNNSGEKLEIITKLWRESCEKNGGPDAYDTVTKGWEDFLACGNKGKSRLRRMHLTTINHLVISMMKYCPIAGIEDYCIKPLKNTIEHCLEPEDRKKFNVIHYFLISLLEFICVDDGARIIKFVQDGGVQCVKSKQRDLLNCATEHNLAIISASPTKLLSFVPEIEDCNNMERFQLCSVKVLNECEHHTSADIANTLFNSVTREMSCQKFPESQASMRSVIDIVLIITIAMAIYFHF